MREITIGKTKIGGDNPCFIVAEIGINFNGKYENAISLIDSAKSAGCNAVKFQLFTAEKMYIPNAGEDRSGEGKKRDIYKIVKEGELPTNWIPKLKEYAESQGLEFFCTVCDEEGADILEKYDVSAYKVASYEITHIPLLKYVARKGKPIIFSCGASEMEEVVEALKSFKEEKNSQIVLLHCVAKYGAKLSSLNLGTINVLKSAFPEIIIGYSDHSTDPIKAPRAAIALGAKIIEKHITLDRNMPGPDHFFALDSSNLSLMVKTIRKTEEELKEGATIEIDPELLGISERKTYKEEEIARDFTHRCLFATEDINQGDFFTKENIAVLRPGNEKRGLEPKYFELLLKGYKAVKNISKHQSITWDDVLSK